MMRLPRHFALVLLALPLQPMPMAAAQDATLTQDRATGAAAIERDLLRTWLTFLASEECAGRGTGQPGFEKAATFVRDKFAEFGLEPGAADGSYFQKVPWSRVKLDPDGTWLQVKAGERDAIRIPNERLRGAASVASHKRGGLSLLVVKEMTEPEGRSRMPEVEGLDELDLEGRVVLVYLHPDYGDGRPGNRARARYGIARQMAGRGVTALVEVDPKEIHGGIQGRSRAGRGAGSPAQRAQAMRPTTVTIGRPDLLQILGAAGLGEDALSGDQLHRPLDLEGELKVSLHTDELPAFNVIGILRGSDPSLRHEYVVVGSHLDHLGQRGATFYPGADDDGSGSVGVLALAKALAENSQKPKRSVAFVTFCGEENGLVGSRFFVDNSPIPLQQITAELQMDMIGRREESRRTGEKAEDNANSLHLVGTKKLSRDLHQLCIAKNEVHGFDLEWDEEGVFTRSDHANFARQGIPIAFFFTGFHADYHRPTDTVDKIDFDKLERIVRYVYDLTFELADAEQRPLVDEDLWKKNRPSLRGAPEQPAAPMRKAGGNEK